MLPKAGLKTCPPRSAMPEVIGIDHIYVAVADLARAEAFYDAVMSVLGFRKNKFTIASDLHIQYFNRHFGFVLRPARRLSPHDDYAPGLHHLCLRVASVEDVSQAAKGLRAAGIETTEPRVFEDYAPDYHAIFFNDPDGLRLEITNYRNERKLRHDEWDQP
jgi:catechol 2,3-dioxygenase-like lactoylglutathione lyase family enzyme